MFLYFCHEVLRRLVVSISHQRPLFLIISHLASIVGYTKNKCVCFLHHWKHFFLSSQNVNLSGLGWVGTLGPPPLRWKIPTISSCTKYNALWALKYKRKLDRQWKNNPVFWVSTSGRQKIQKNYVVHIVPGPQVPPPAPAVQSKGEVLLGD